MAATPSDPPGLATDDVERRLHPLSWLFAMLQQLKQFALPLLVLLVTGRGNRYELLGLIGAAGIAVVALIQYVTFRFRLSQHSIVITSGLLQRTRRDLPYERIHNVIIHQSILHRAFGVAEVRLESAGGQQAEAHMRVLSLADAQALEQLARRKAAASAGDVATPSTADAIPTATTRLLALPTSEVIALGLISNRGMVLVAAAIGAVWQVLPEGAEPDDIVRWLVRTAVSEARTWPTWLTGTAGLIIGSIATIGLALVAIRLLSVALAILQFHGFTLDDTGRQLRVERGLLTRIRLHLPPGRIQAWRLTETVLHRWFGRRSLRVDTAGGTDTGATKGFRDLVPLAPPSKVDDLVAHVRGRATWPPTEWRALHPHAWRRLVVLPTLLLGLGIGLLTWRVGALGLLAISAWPLVVLRARTWAKHAGYAEVSGDFIAVRQGWLTKTWAFADLSKLQTLRLTASPFDRRHRMATVWLDTAGASGGEPFRIRFLPEDEARALYDRLSRAMEPAI